MFEETADESVSVEQQGAVMTVWLNRPAVHNALDAALIARLTAVFTDLAARDDVRVVILSGLGRSFCAGADLGFMRATATADFAQNVAESEAIYDLMHTLDTCSKPVIGRINGAAIGGGAGLVCCCDIAVASRRAVFAFSEVRLGVVPAVISPFVVSKIGSGQARRLFLSGERFGAENALAIGLVHEVAAEEELDERVALHVAHLLAGAPGAQTAVKALLRGQSGREPAERRAALSRLIAERRASAEGQEGMSAFLQKREPWWRLAASQEKGDENE